MNRVVALPVLEQITTPVSVGLKGTRQRAALLVVGGTAALAGVGEAVQLVLLVALAGAVTDAEAVARIEVGPLDLSAVSPARLVAVAVAISVCTLVLQLSNGAMLARLATSALSSARREYFLAYNRASMRTQQAMSVGLPQELLTNHCLRASAGVLLVGSMLTALLNFLALMVSAVLVNPVASGAIILMIVVMGGLLRPLVRATRRRSQQQADAGSVYASFIADTSRMTVENRVFGAQQAVENAHDAVLHRVTQPYFWSRLLLRALPDLYRNLVLLLVVLGLFAASAVAADRVGALGAIVLLLVRALGYTQVLQNNMQKLRENAPYISALREAIDALRGNAESDGVVEVHGPAGVSFRNVSFAYLSDAPVLRGVDFSIPAGSSLGVVGPSGSGKTTLANLLLRTLRPSDGSIFIGDVSLEDVSSASLYRHVAFSPQMSALRHATARDNIAFYRDLADETIEGAARAAHIHDELQGLPGGYDTVLSGAMQLSGGQRQRMALARAIAGTPALLVLDEPTSSLDQLSESVVQRTLDGLHGSTTLVVIAHRLSTIRRCDYLLVLQDGVVEAFGPTQTVMQRSQFFTAAAATSPWPVLP